MYCLQYTEDQNRKLSFDTRSVTAMIILTILLQSTTQQKLSVKVQFKNLIRQILSKKLFNSHIT